eukprot:UN29851
MRDGKKLAGDSKETLKMQTVTPADTIYPVETKMSLPLSMYSAAMVIPLCQVGSSTYQKWIIYIQITLLYLANGFIQLGLITYVYWIYQDQEDEYGECGGYKTRQPVRWMCILLYTAVCAGDIVETMKLAFWTWYFPSTSEPGAWEKLSYEVVEQADGDTVTEYKSGMNTLYRVYIFLIVLAPKMMLALALLGYGTGFIVTTNDEAEILLNALALVFVLEIDEL